MKERTLEQLLQEIKEAIEAKENADKARVGAEIKRRKANCQYNLLIQALRAKEYTI